jgi:hypothetical protein
MLPARSSRNVCSRPKRTRFCSFLAGCAGTSTLPFKEGTSAALLYDLIQPHVTEVVLCDPRQNALLNHGNKSDLIDVRKLADLLRSNQLKPGGDSAERQARAWAAPTPPRARTYAFNRLLALPALMCEDGDTSGAFQPKRRANRIVG